jgi:predicted RNase H-like nuclease (RuvC/YqgF family)
MNDRGIEELRRENEYLKLRNAQLQRDVVALEAEGERLRQELERRLSRGLNRAPLPQVG